jgi:hypothetical protein
MKFASFLLSALCLAIVSCERHNLEETKHLYEEHSTHEEHQDGHGAAHDSKGHKDTEHGAAAH